DLARAEGTLLRYLGDAYRALVQTVPAWAKTDATHDVELYLRATLRGTDASLLEEWERIGSRTEAEPVEGDVTDERRSFEVLVRTATLRLVRLLARGRYDDAAELLGARWPGRALDAALAPYFAEHSRLRTDGDAISKRAVVVEQAQDAWRVRVTLFDDEGETP